MRESNDVERFKKFKKDSGYSYDKLSKALGVHHRTVYQWLSGKTKPSPMGGRCIKEFLKKYHQG